MKERAVYEVQEELQVPHNSNVEVWTALGVSTGAQLRLYRRWGWRNWEDTGDKIAGATGATGCFPLYSRAIHRASTKGSHVLTTIISAPTWIGRHAARSGARAARFFELAR